MTSRRIALMVEETRPRPDRVVVMRADVLGQFGAVVRPLSDGWVLGVLEWRGPRLLYPSTAPIGDWRRRDERPEIATEVITFKEYSGMVWGAADDRAPERLVCAAFERLWWERADKVGRRFLRERR